MRRGFYKKILCTIRLHDRSFMNARFLTANLWLYRSLKALHCKACDLDVGQLLISLTMPLLVALAKQPRRLRKEPGKASRQSKSFSLDSILDHLPDQVMHLPELLCQCLINERYREAPIVK